MGGYYFQLRAQAAKAEDGGWTLGAFLSARDGVDCSSPAAAALLKGVSIFKGAPPPPTTAGERSDGGFSCVLMSDDPDDPDDPNKNVLGMAPMMTAYDAAALAPHLDADGKLCVSAVVRALG